MSFSRGESECNRHTLYKLSTRTRCRKQENTDLLYENSKKTCKYVVYKQLKCNAFLEMNNPWPISMFLIADKFDLLAYVMTLV